MRKEGMTHIEVVLAFIIFISSVLAILYFFNVSPEGNVANSSSGYTYSNLYNYASSPVESISLSISNPPAQISIPLDQKIQGLSSEYKVYAYTLTNRLPAKREGNNVYIENTDNQKYVGLFFYQNYTENPSGNSPVINDVSSVVLRESKIALSEKKILGINKSYHSDYTELKKALGIPNNVDFGFVLEYNGIQIKALRTVPNGLEVISKTESVEVISDNGGLVYGRLDVGVW